MRYIIWTNHYDTQAWEKLATQSIHNQNSNIRVPETFSQWSRFHLMWRTACLKNSLMWFIWICLLCRHRRRCISLWMPLLPIKIYCSHRVCALLCDGLCFNFYASFTFFSHFVCQSLGIFPFDTKMIFTHGFIVNNFVIYIIFFIGRFAHFAFFIGNRMIVSEIANKPKRPHKFKYIHVKLVFISHQNFYRIRLIENTSRFVWCLHLHTQRTTFLESTNKSFYLDKKQWVCAHTFRIRRS